MPPTKPVFNNATHPNWPFLTTFWPVFWFFSRRFFFLVRPLFKCPLKDSTHLKKKEKYGERRPNVHQGEKLTGVVKIRIQCITVYVPVKFGRRPATHAVARRRAPRRNRLTVRSRWSRCPWRRRKEIRRDDFQYNAVKDSDAPRSVSEASAPSDAER